MSTHGGRRQPQPEEVQLYKRALVGVDEAPSAEAFLCRASDLRSWGIQSLVLAHIVPIGRVQGAGYGHEREYKSWLDERAAPLREAGLTVTTSVTASGAPADELLDVARAECVDLVVVGSRSHDLLYEIFLGSVAREVVRKSTIPVLVQRLEPKQIGHAETCAAGFEHALARILLATDLSLRSGPAEDAVVRLAANAGPVDCLTVLAVDATADDRRAVESRHQALIRRIKEVGGNAGSRIEQGEPSAAILHASQEGYSLIVVGKHGQNWVEGKIMGSTAAKVCDGARRTVLIVPLQQG